MLISCSTVNVKTLATNFIAKYLAGVGDILVQLVYKALELHAQGFELNPVQVRLHSNILRQDMN